MEERNGVQELRLPLTCSEKDKLAKIKDEAKRRKLCSSWTGFLKLGAERIQQAMDEGLTGENNK